MTGPELPDSARADATFNDTDAPSRAIEQTADRATFVIDLKYVAEVIEFVSFGAWSSCRIVIIEHFPWATGL